MVVSPICMDSMPVIAAGIRIAFQQVLAFQGAGEPVDRRSIQAGERHQFGQPDTVLVVMGHQIQQLQRPIDAAGAIDRFGLIVHIASNLPLLFLNMNAEADLCWFSVWPTIPFSLKNVMNPMVQ